MINLLMNILFAAFFSAFFSYQAYREVQHGNDKWAIAAFAIAAMDFILIGANISDLVK